MCHERARILPSKAFARKYFPIWDRMRDRRGRGNASDKGRTGTNPAFGGRKPPSESSGETPEDKKKRDGGRRAINNHQRRMEEN